MCKLFYHQYHISSFLHVHQYVLEFQRLDVEVYCVCVSVAVHFTHTHALSKKATDATWTSVDCNAKHKLLPW